MSETTSEDANACLLQGSCEGTSYQDIRQYFSDVIQQISISQLGQFAQCEILKAEYFLDYGLGQVLANHMVLATVSSDNVQVLLKLHFDNNQAKNRFKSNNITSTELDLEPKDIDYMKELTNQICGCLCRKLSDIDIVAGLSIPLYTRGYYEIYSSYAVETSPFIKFGNSWKLEGDFGAVYMSYYMESANGETLTQLNAISASDDENEIEFM